LPRSPGLRGGSVTPFFCRQARTDSKRALTARGKRPAVVAPTLFDDPPHPIKANAVSTTSSSAGRPLPAHVVPARRRVRFPERRSSSTSEVSRSLDSGQTAFLTKRKSSRQHKWRASLHPRRSRFQLARRRQQPCLSCGLTYDLHCERQPRLRPRKAVTRSPAGSTRDHPNPRRSRRLRHRDCRARQTRPAAHRIARADRAFGATTASTCSRRWPCLRPSVALAS
jgi:hypothetical protein